MADGPRQVARAAAPEAASTASEPIDETIARLGDWRGETPARIRDAGPDVVEEVKWRKPSNPSGVATLQPA